MRGCIIKSNKVTIKEVFLNIKEAEKYNWLITYIECYPRSQKIQKIFDGEYCWLTGKELLEIMNQEEFQWIWGGSLLFKYWIRYIQKSRENKKDSGRSD